jgi:hypothetical protein
MTKESHAWRGELNVAKQRESELFLRILRDRSDLELQDSHVNSPSVPYLDPQYRTGHPCTRTSSVLYFLIRYLDPKVEEMREDEE